MRLVIHQALKDIRSLRWMLVVWLALVAALHVVALLGLRVPPADFVRDTTLMSAHTAFLAMMAGAFVVIPALVMQNDPAVGTTAFWFTRPISRPVLIAGKLLVATSAFVVLPVLVDAITLLVAGVELPSVLATAGEALAVQAVWLLPVMALAAMTTSLAQFVLAALLEVVFFLALVTLARLRGPVFFAVSWEMVTIVYMTALLVAAVALIVAAYWWRDMKRATVVAIAAPVFVLVAMTSWTWELPSSWPFAAGTQVGIVAKAAGIPVTPNPNGETMAIPVDLSLSGLSPRQRQRITVEDAWLQYGKERVNLAVNLGVEPPRDLSASTTTIYPFASWRAVEHRVNDPAVFHAILRVRTIEQRETTVPMSPGATYQLGGGRGEIVGVRVEEPPRLMVTLREIGLEERFQSGEKLEYLIRNARTGDTRFDGRPYVPSPFVSLFFLPVSEHLVANWHFLAVTPPPGSVQPTESDIARWLRESKLTIIESRQTGSFVRHVEIPNLVLSSLLKGGV
jgi:hypothetical protein